MSTTFDLALQASGPPYVSLELDLARAAQLDPAEAAWLREQQSRPDPAASLLAAVALSWAGPKGDDYKRALQYMEEAAIELAPTAIGYPPPVGVEGYLTLHFGNRLAELLALRLIKEPAWPHWKKASAILYLQAHKVPATTGALIRFAIETGRADQRELTIDAIREMADPELHAKLTFERARAKKMNHPVPASVAGLDV